MPFDPDKTPFNPDDPFDATAEKARRVLISAFLEELPCVTDAEQYQAVAAGMLVGLLGVLASMAERTDANDAALRSGMIQLIPWAIDMVRSVEGRTSLPPIQ